MAKSLRRKLRDTKEKRVRSRLDSLWRQLIVGYGELHSTYHPVSTLKGTTRDKRDIGQRWDLIAGRLDESHKSALDFGCAEGYLSFKLADKGIVTIGIDNRLRRIALARARGVLENRSRVGFIYADLDPELVRSLPTMDVTLFLSLHHHLIYQSGMEWATSLLRLVFEKTRNVMFYDLGQPQELNQTWRTTLPDMGASAEKWVGDYLRGIGFSQVVKIGETLPPYKHPDPQFRRPLFAAYV